MGVHPPGRINSNTLRRSRKMRRRLSRHPKENPMQAKTPAPVGVQRQVGLRSKTVASRRSRRFGQGRLLILDGRKIRKELSNVEIGDGACQFEW
jgi:hypothetical protein